MKFDLFQIADCYALRFGLDVGVVWALVYVQGDGEARLEVYEQAAVVAGSRPGAYDGREATPEDEAAKNRFGTGRILRVLRSVKEAFPGVKRWVYRRVSGGGPLRSGGR